MDWGIYSGVVEFYEKLPRQVSRGPGDLRGYRWGTRYRGSFEDTFYPSVPLSGPPVPGNFVCPPPGKEVYPVLSQGPGPSSVHDCRPGVWGPDRRTRDGRLSPQTPRPGSEPELGDVQQLVQQRELQLRARDQSLVEVDRGVEGVEEEHLEPVSAAERRELGQVKPPLAAQDDEVLRVEELHQPLRQ